VRRVRLLRTIATTVPLDDVMIEKTIDDH